MPGTKQLRAWATLLGLAVATGSGFASAGAREPLLNPFHDPFAQVTHGLADCPQASPPTYTGAEMREVEHHRAERGNSCFLAGKCRFASSYDYDRGIAAGLFPALASAPTLRGTSIWVLVEGRFVQLFGCVTDKAQIAQAQRLAAARPDVQAVLPTLMVGTRGKPPYTVLAPPR